MTEGQYSLLDRGRKRRTDKHKNTLGDVQRKEEGVKEGRIDGWMKRTGIDREHLVWEFWVILLTMEPPSQTKTLAQIESKSADKVPDKDNCTNYHTVSHEASVLRDNQGILI